MEPKDQQPHFLCCCGVGRREARRNTTVTDGLMDDVPDGNNLKTCICCWCMGCDSEGVYVWLKNLLIVYNFVFWLLGCLFLGFGIYSEVMRQQFSDAEHVFLTPSIVLLVIGIFSFVVSTIGLVGALRDNICFLKVAKNFVNVYVLKGLTTYYDDQDLKDVVDYMQETFECCGGQLYTDWEVNIYHNCSSPGPMACGVPYSCCLPGNGSININSMCGYDTMHLDVFVASNFIFLNGCIDAFIDFLYLNLDVLAGILLGVFVPQITGIILGFLYVSQINQVIEGYSTPNYPSEALPLHSSSSGRNIPSTRVRS